VTPSPPPPAVVSHDLEIKDAQLIFNRVWRELEKEFGREHLHFPKELILLGGAPGSGKGTNTAFICQVRGISAPPIVISELLNSPEAKKIKAGGGMVGDEEVLRLLLRELLKPRFRDSVVLDGFPRTTVQVECLKMFYDQMILLRREFSNTPVAHHFRQPTFHIMVLFVDEADRSKSSSKTSSTSSNTKARSNSTPAPTTPSAISPWPMKSSSPPVRNSSTGSTAIRSSIPSCFSPSSISSRIK